MFQTFPDELLAEEEQIRDIQELCDLLDEQKSTIWHDVLTNDVHSYIIPVMAFDINFNEEKNQLLKATRGVGFDEIIDALGKGALLADIAHPSVSRLNQRLYVVKIKQYAYTVPYVINNQKNEIFLKTVYPSSALTKKYIKGDNHE